VTALVVTHVVTAKIATDEEWRSYYGSNSFQTANSAMESADDKMFVNWGIDFQQYQTANWDSSPDSGVNACDLLNDLKADLSPGSSDVLLGFAKNPSTNYAGCSEIDGDEAEVNWDGSSYNRWVTTQHEIGHLFAAPDRYPDPNNLHIDDVMENQFTDPDFWCSHYQQYAGDYTIISLKAPKFG
jgi:hypothetical protein